MRLILLILLIAIGSCGWLDIAQARPGGGHSSSSSSSSHSSSGSGFSWGSHSGSNTSGFSSGSSNSEEITHPMSSLLALVIVIIIVVAIVIVLKNMSRSQTFVVMPTLENRSRQQLGVAQQLTLLKQSDANFSGILFLDFVHSLYSKFYSYSTHPEFSYLSPFLSVDLQQHFQQNAPWQINEVVINGIKWLEYTKQGTEMESLSVHIDANYTLHLQGKHTRYAVQERWQFLRQQGVLSAEPEKMQTLCCPHCGAPAHFTDAGSCEYCGKQVQKGGMQWYLGKRVVLSTTALSSNELVAYAQEQGTQLSTIKQLDLSEQMQRFQELHAYGDWPAFWQSFETEIVRAYFLTIYQHWSQRNWQAARHLLSDRLYEANVFWQNLYAEHDWYNRLDNLQIERVVLVKIETDKYYEAITVRIFAACNDYTEDAQGKLLGGNKKELRHYSEYWTLVRRAGIVQHSKPYSLSQCPQCGAPADNMGQTAECGYCGSKISTGQFSWVLFLITQDEVYEG
ncbi:TIM44-like domain-containing protein [Methylomonas sp. AM2-LC]|uniref:TIM44-like domain-containing protein n=1 Tax=Methylomonas sp. AM2-LC TaxID=3153301 RepID=UPI0032661497